MTENEGGIKLPKIEWKDGTYFKKKEAEQEVALEEIRKTLDRLEDKGEIIKEFDKERNDWVYKPKKKGE